MTWPERCAWAERSALERDYHDHEWGVPEHDDRRLFEWLLLEGAQAGLSWRTILEKREGYRDAFDGFDPARIAAFNAAREAALLRHEGIVRNRQKIRSAILNARAFCDLQDRKGGFAPYLWSFVDGRPVQNVWTAAEGLPAQTEVSRHLSHSLRKHGFSFVGPVICYSFMQATGLVDDHLVGCFRIRKAPP